MKNLILTALLCCLAVSGYTQTKTARTIKNLKSGIKGEITASSRYAAFAQKAYLEGQTCIARLFEAASRSEAIHAANHKRALKGLGETMVYFIPDYEVKTTAENLQSAIEGETYEVTTMYPQFINEAATEKKETATNSFTWAFETEKKHQQFYSNALSSLKAKNVFTLPYGYAVCPICGNTFEKLKVGESCPFCYTRREMFINL